MPIILFVIGGISGIAGALLVDTSKTRNSVGALLTLIAGIALGAGLAIVLG